MWGAWGQPGCCECERGVRAARAPGRRVNGRGAARVHTRNGRAGRYAMRTARGSRAGEGRPACAVRGVRVPARGPGVLSTGRGPCVRRRAVRWGCGGRGGVLTPAPRTSRRSGSGVDTGSGSRSRAGFLQRACTSADPGGRPQRHPAVSAGCLRAAGLGPGARPAGRRTGAAPQSGHAPRSPLRAPSRSRPPARSLFNLKRQPRALLLLRGAARGASGA